MTHLRQVVLPLQILLVMAFAATLAAQTWAVPAALPDHLPEVQQSLERAYLELSSGSVEFHGGPTEPDRAAPEGAR